MAVTFSHVQLYVHDLSAAMRFYQRLLRFMPGYVAEPEYTALRRDAMQFSIALHKAHEASEVGNGPIPYLLSDELEETIRELREKKVEVGEPRCEGDSPRFTTFKDSEGNYWGLQEASSH